MSHSKAFLESLGLSQDDFLFLPLGGANEVGMNFNLYHYKGKWLIVDCGIGFSGSDIPGVDILLPKIDFIKKHKLDIVGMVITHIHEDHIGAVGYLWEQLRCKIFATKLAKNFLMEKISEFSFKDKVQVEILDINSKASIAPFNIELVGITHSVPEMQGVFIETPFGPVFHTGDWKIDKNPIVGEPTNFKRIEEIAKQKPGIYAMTCDSTNVFVEGSSGSESSLEDSICDIIKKHDGRVIFTTFASNVARLKTITDVAQKTSRKIVLSGRSITRMVKVAKQSGYLLDDHDEFLDQDEASSVNKSKTIVVCTGCQGEELASLSKMANGTNKYIKLERGDLIIFSSKVIPGNEKKIYSLYNKFAQLDVDIITEKTHNVHVSGHPAREELKKMYSIAKPKIAIPVHGDQARIKEHCILAEKWGVESLCRVKNGDLVLFEKNAARIVCSVEHGYNVLDGYLIRPTESKVLSDRLILSKSGMAYCVITGKDVSVITDGFLSEKEDAAFCFDLKKTITDYIKDNRPSIVEAYKSKDFGLVKRYEKSILKICERYTKKQPLVRIVAI